MVQRTYAGNLIPTSLVERAWSLHQRSTRHWLALLMILAGLALAARAAEGSGLLAGVGCNIKGNISVWTGEWIYHVRGGKYYDATRISLSNGERWFCSEEEARAAGWWSADESRPHETPFADALALREKRELEPGQ